MTARSAASLRPARRDPLAINHLQKQRLHVPFVGVLSLGVVPTTIALGSSSSPFRFSAVSSLHTPRKRFPTHSALLPYRSAHRLRLIRASLSTRCTNGGWWNTVPTPGQGLCDHRWASPRAGCRRRGCEPGRVYLTLASLPYPSRTVALSPLRRVSRPGDRNNVDPCRRVRPLDRARKGRTGRDAKDGLELEASYPAVRRQKWQRRLRAPRHVIFTGANRVRHRPHPPPARPQAQGTLSPASPSVIGARMSLFPGWTSCIRIHALRDDVQTRTSSWGAVLSRERVPRRLRELPYWITVLEDGVDGGRDIPRLSGRSRCGGV
ncbi:hypothetical protein C8R45DRAFT_413455 [Mycena sanguinolenta]|nr:hypothetical protein C8R45DRAFT_413455 [Mycena sanguinolenta]